MRAHFQASHPEEQAPPIRQSFAYICHICKFEAKNKRILATHYCALHPNEQVPTVCLPNDPYLCKLCPFKAINRYHLCAHHCASHPNEQAPSVRISTASHKCKTCDLQFSKLADLYRHSNEHELPRYKQCYTCQPRQLGMFAHTTTDANILCRICLYPFPDKKQLRAHTKRYHERDTQCPSCLQTFVWPPLTEASFSDAIHQLITQLTSTAQPSDPSPEPEWLTEYNRIHNIAPKPLHIPNPEEIWRHNHNLEYIKSYPPKKLAIEIYDADRKKQIAKHILKHNPPAQSSFDEFLHWQTHNAS